MLALHLVLKMVLVMAEVWDLVMEWEKEDL